MNSLAKIRHGPMVKRFTKSQQELAVKISNDIAEGIDCHESKAVLRMAIAFYSDLAAATAQEKSALESKLLMIKTREELELRESLKRELWKQ